jgi:rod shape-determining protein MreC
MPSLRQDVFHRREARNGTRPVLGATFFCLVLLSIALLAMSRLRSDVVKSIEAEIVGAATPVLAWAVSAVQPVRQAVVQFTRALELEEEAGRLRAENDRLRLVAWRVAELEHKVAELERLQKVVPDPKSSVVVARAISPGNGPFSRTALLNAGRDDGVRDGLAVVTARGLVGRIESSTGRGARMLLLTDERSRIPVFVGASQTRAVLAGDGTEHPRLTLFSANVRIGVGDEVITSGIGGMLPRGLKIGIVGAASDDQRVELFVDGSIIDYVSVLIVGDPPHGMADDRPAARAAAASTRRGGPTSGGR